MVDDHAIRRGLAELLHTISGTGRYIPVVGMLIVIGLSWTDIQWWTAAPVLLLHSLATWLSDRLRGKNISELDDDAVSAWLDKYTVTSLISGCAWGLAAFFWIDLNNVIATAFLFMLLVSVVFGSVLSRGMHLPCLMAFELPIFLFMNARFLQEDLQLGLTLLGFSLLVLLAVILWGRKINENMSETVRLRHVNESLIGELEKARVQAERDRDAAKAGIRTRDQFLAMISHEIRTPLNSISGLTDELRRSDGQSETDRSYLDAIRASTDSLAVLLDDILTMSSVPVYEERETIQIKDFDIRRFARQLEIIFEDKAKQAGLNLIVSVAKDVPRGVSGDETRIRQILFNLIGNAIRFTADGFVSLSITLEGKELDRDAVIRFSVSDSGIGIPSDMRDAIFEPFTQANVSVREQYGGTGLGLAICERLIQRMGSRINVESVQGEGSRFWFDLNLPVASGALDEDFYLPTGEGIVLLAEDDVILAKVMKAGLTAAGYVTYHATSAEDALIILEEGTVTHLVLDLGLPDRDGLSVLQEVQNMPEISGEMKTLVLSGHADQDTRDKALALGAQKFMVKPIDLPEFLSALSE